MKILAILLLVMVLPAVLSAQSEKERLKIEADILAVLDAQAAAWNRGDIDGFMRGYWNSENLVFVSGDSVTRGWQPTLDRYKKNYDSKEKMGALKFGDLSFNIVSKDAAVILGSWSLTRSKDNPKGRFTLIFRKLKDGWRIVHDHTS